MQGDPTRSHSERSETITIHSERNPGISPWTVTLLPIWTKELKKKKTGGVTIDRSSSIDPLHGTRPIARIAGASFAEQREKAEVKGERVDGGTWEPLDRGKVKPLCGKWYVVAEAGVSARLRGNNVIENSPRWNAGHALLRGTFQNE